MTAYPLIVKRQIKGSSIWEQRNGMVIQSPFFLFCAECIRRKTGKREVVHFWSVTPGCAAFARGYKHAIPLGLRQGRKGEWRTKNAERGRCHYYVYGVTNLVTEVTEFVTRKESLTILLKKLRRADNPLSGK